MVSLQHSQEQQCIGAGEQKWQEDGLGCQQLKHLTDVGSPHRQQEHEALPDEDSVLLENLEERPSARTKQIKGLSPSLTRPLIVLSKAAKQCWSDEVWGTCPEGECNFRRQERKRLVPSVNHVDPAD